MDRLFLTRSDLIRIRRSTLFLLVGFDQKGRIRVHPSFDVRTVVTDYPSRRGGKEQIQLRAWLDESAAGGGWPPPEQTLAWSGTWGLPTPKIRSYSSTSPSGPSPPAGLRWSSSSISHLKPPTISGSCTIHPFSYCNYYFCVSNFAILLLCCMFRETRVVKKDECFNNCHCNCQFECNECDFVIVHLGE